MGTLDKQKNVNENKTDNIEKKQLKLKSKNEKKLHKEYKKIRRNLEELRRAFSAVEDADETDDIYHRLYKLEKVSKRIRKGSSLSGGAKTHRKLLKKLQ